MYENIIVIVTFVGLDASSVIVIVTVLEPLWRDLLHKVSYLAVVVPVLHHAEEAIDRCEKVLNLRGVDEPVPLAYSHSTAADRPVVCVDSVVFDMHAEQADALAVVLLVSLARGHLEPVLLP